jgi:hypothetical protein
MTMKPDTWKKTAHFCLGLALGTLTGVLSTFGADPMGLLMRPPLVFGLACMSIIVLHLRVKWHVHFSYLALFFPIYWLVFLLIDFGSFAVMGGLGAFLVYLALFAWLRLKWVHWFFVSGAIIFFSLLGWEMWEAMRPFVPAENTSHSDPSAGQGGSGWDFFTVLFCYWQALMLAFLSVQLYIEKRHRAAEAAAIIHLPGPPSNTPPTDG